MLRTTFKFPLGHITRISAPSRRLPRQEIRLHQSTHSGGGGGGGKVFLLFGTLTAATAGTAVYAKYDPSFRKLVEDNVPYSDIFFTKSNELMDMVTSLVSSSEKAPDTPQPIKAQPIVVPKPVQPAAKPAAVEAKPAPAEVKAKTKSQIEAERKLTELRIALDTASLAATAAHSQATQKIKGLGSELSRYSSTDPDSKILAHLISQNDSADQLASKAAEAGIQARSQLAALKRMLEISGLPSSSEEVNACQQSLTKAENQLNEAENSLKEAQGSLKPSQALQSQIDDARHMLQQELGPHWNASKKEDQELFVLMVALRMLDYKSQLARQSQAHEKALQESLVAAGDAELEERIKLHLADKEEELKQQLNKDFGLQLAKLREEEERRTQIQLNQQAALLADEKSSALLSQRTAFARELSERMGQQMLQHTIQIGSAMEVLQKADKNLHERLGEIRQGAELLAISRSCDALARSLDVNPFPALDWTHQRREIDGHVRDVKKAFKNDDEFVKVTLNLIPESVVNRGVFTEPSLKARFVKVERVARRVSMIKDYKDVKLTAYVLSYLRSCLIREPTFPITAVEVANDAAKIADFDNNALLDRARYFVEQGDLLQAVKYMNLLQGPSRYIASGWLEEARNLLEVKHVAQTLAAYASLLVQQKVINKETK